MCLDIDDNWTDTELKYNHSLTLPPEAKTQDMFK